MFRSFVDFCRSCGVRKDFLKAGSDEELRLRAWLKVADPTFHTELFASADWQYIATHNRQELDPAILAPLIGEVQTKYRHKHRNDQFKIMLEHNDHCSAV